VTQPVFSFLHKETKMPIIIFKVLGGGVHPKAII